MQNKHSNKYKHFFIGSKNKKMSELETIKHTIEQLDVRHHLMIGKILKQNQQVKMNDSKNGILINLSVIPENTMQEIQQYLAYIKDQETTLTKIESETEEYKQLISEKGNKDNLGNVTISQSDSETTFPHLI